MQRFRQDLTLAQVDDGPIFIGRVLRQNLVDDDAAESLRVTSVTFEDGARNRWHRHTTEQVLVITHGQGIVANESETLQVTRGDVILVPPGERHWHRAETGDSMTHLSVLLPGEMTIDEES